jgi:hypothetical protein
MKYYIIYKITNLVNNRYYIGRHSTNNLNDGYLGSGKAILNAIKKYGKENFKKEILAETDDSQKLWELESQIVNEQVVNDPLSYNMTYGGKHYLYGLRNFNYKKFLSHQSESGKLGGKASIENHKIKFPNNEWHRKGALASAKKRRSNPKFKYEIITTNNDIYLVNRNELISLCKDMNWNYATLTWNLSYTREKTIKRGSLTGYQIKMIVQESTT